MSLDIHPSAEQNFNEKSNEFIDAVKIFTKTHAVNKSFPSDVYVSKNLSKEDIVGDIDFATTDYQGKRKSRYFHFNGKMYGIDGDDYKRLFELSEKIQALPNIRKRLSVQYVEKILFFWVANKYKGMTDESFFDFLKNESSSVIRKNTLWVPIANLEIEKPFCVSNCEIRPFSKEVIDLWEGKKTDLPDDQKNSFEKLIEDIRRKFQGWASVVIVCDAEPDYATAYAIKEAQKVVAAIGVYSMATVIPDIKCVSRIKGCENIEVATVFTEHSSGLMQMMDTTLDVASARTWRLSDIDVSEMMKNGLEKISLLMSCETGSKFQNMVLDSVFLYSKSAFTSDPVEKIVYILSSMESILLKNESEPIQQNLAERVALLISNQLDERKDIVKKIKKIYGVRSRYLHHGHNSSDWDLVFDFLVIARAFINGVLNNCDSFVIKEDFIDAIDDCKLS